MPLQCSMFIRIPVRFSKSHSFPRPPSEGQQQAPARSPRCPGATNPQLLLFKSWPFTPINTHNCQHWHRVPLLFVGSLSPWFPQGPNPLLVPPAWGCGGLPSLQALCNSQLPQSRPLAHRSPILQVDLPVSHFLICCTTDRKKYFNVSIWASNTFKRIAGWKIMLKW